MSRSIPGIDFLLASDEPAIRYLARRDLLGVERKSDKRAIVEGPKVRALLSGQAPTAEFNPGPGWRRSPGAELGFGVNPYRKWTGGHWRLVSLAELEAPGDDPRVVRAIDHVLGWRARPASLRSSSVVDGLPRRCASIDGNVVLACSKLGAAGDERVARVAKAIVGWQWPDGGWNCDLKATGYRSSFHESLIPALGLWEYGTAVGDDEALAAAGRAAELFLSHRLFRKTSDGTPIRREWLVPHYPPYWHYDVLHALHALCRMGYGGDPRLDDGVELMLERRLPDGTWAAGAFWWKPLGTGRDSDRGLKAGSVEVVDWGRDGPNEMITLNMLRVLKATGRLS